MYQKRPSNDGFLFAYLLEHVSANTFNGNRNVTLVATATSTCWWLWNGYDLSMITSKNQAVNNISIRFGFRTET